MITIKTERLIGLRIKDIHSKITLVIKLESFIDCKLDGQHGGMQDDLETQILK